MLSRNACRKASVLILGFLISTLLLLLATTIVHASFGSYNYVEILKVKDGDTVEVMVEVYPDTFVRTDVRVYGIDTPETRRGVKSGKRIPECELLLGERSKEFAIELIESADSISLVGVSARHTKYAGRISGDFFLRRGEEFHAFSDEMIKAGHAVEYDGGSREIWPCGEEE